MFELPASRFRLIALDAHQLRLTLEDPHSLELMLGLCSGSAAVADELRGPVQQMLDGVLGDLQDYLWHTHWLIVLHQSPVVAGGLCFKGRPDPSGEVEIGYGISAPYQNHGLATEAVQTLCGWALGQPGVNAVLAETEKDNLASQRVLVKTGFHVFRETDTMRWWRLEAESEGG